MRNLLTRLIPGIVLAAVLPCAGAAAAVVVNGTELNPAQIEAHAGQLGHRIPDGRYWYDRMTGAWGREGQGTAGSR